MPEILLRPERGKTAMRLKCRFAIDAAPRKPYYRALWERELERARYKAADWFVQDMAKEGWEYQGRFPWRFRGPFPVIPIITLPKRSQQQRWHIPAWEMLPAIMAGYRPDLDQGPEPVLARTIASLDESDTWEYELSAVFSHPTILVEAPDSVKEMVTL